MTDITSAINVATPYFNMALVLVMIYMFVKLFRIVPVIKVYMLPWYLVFAAIMVFVLEEAFTILRHAGVFPYEVVYLNGLFELIIVSLMVYLLLLQREYIATTKH